MDKLIGDTQVYMTERKSNINTDQKTNQPTSNQLERCKNILYYEIKFIVLKIMEQMWMMLQRKAYTTSQVNLHYNSEEEGMDSSFEKWVDIRESDMHM